MTTQPNAPSPGQGLTQIQETILTDGDDFFSSLIQDIRQAKASVDLETYTFNRDATGEMIADTLIEAAQHGVTVRILVDGAGTPFWGGSFAKKMERAGIKTRIYHPFPWGLWQWNRSVINLPWVVKVLYLIYKINSRNHRKVCIIDQRVAYVGSLNITHSHMSRNQGGDGWRDTGVRITDTNLEDLQMAFDAAWDHTTLQKRFQQLFEDVDTDATFRLNNSWHRRRALYKNLLRRIGKCKERIWITNAYFVPNNFLLKKLKDAAEKGIDVRILLPQNSDVRLVNWTAAMFYRSLLKHGVRIFEYLPGILHAKTLIIDDFVTVGTSNLNHRSLLHDLEVDVNLQQAEAKKLITEQFLQDLTQAREVDITTWQKRPLYKRIIGYFMLYTKYWI